MTGFGEGAGDVAESMRAVFHTRCAAGRPLDSPGWGKLVAVKTGAYVSERNPADHTTIGATLERKREELERGLPASRRGRATKSGTLTPFRASRSGSLATTGRSSSPGPATARCCHERPGRRRARAVGALLARALEDAEQRAHAARPQRKPARFYVRRNAHRTYLRHIYGRSTCR
jgi:hypothetical protein